MQCEWRLITLVPKGNAMSNVPQPQPSHVQTCIGSLLLANGSGAPDRAADRLPASRRFTGGVPPARVVLHGPSRRAATFHLTGAWGRFTNGPGADPDVVSDWHAFGGTGRQLLRP